MFFVENHLKRSHFARFKWICIFGLVFTGWSSATIHAQTGDNKPIHFSRDIQPILAEKCWKCHGVDEQSRQADLRLDLREAAIQSKAIVPGQPSQSHLMQRILEHDDAKRMPPPESKKSLSNSEIQLFKDWIHQGAPYERHWAFEQPIKPILPATNGKSWIKDPIDAFVLARIEQQGWKPSPEAERATLLRRVTLDLTGLPPSLEDMAAFLSDPSGDAYEKVVDRLLGSRRHSEKMAMHWLDAARYADTNGYNNDEDRTMWPWRDWVIDAFDRNMPYDQFLVEQLAGDMLPNATLSQRLATAFHRNLGHNTEGGIIQEEYRVEYVADRVHTTATILMGLSMQCARCHDHKYDPISQREYYQFYAFFNQMEEKQGSYSKFKAAEPFLSIPTKSEQIELDLLEKRRKLAADTLVTLESEADQLLEDWSNQHSTAARNKLLTNDAADAAEGKPIPNASELLAIPKAKRTEHQQASAKRIYLDRIDPLYSKLKLHVEELEQRKREIEDKLPAVMIMQDMVSPRDTFVLKRGQYDQPGEKVAAGVPGALSSLESTPPRNRLDLAQWLVARNHPLTARVAVNRWWQMIFGNGIVRTTEDFGVTGEPPTHPELLDYLATELHDSHWDVKVMLKRMVTSATYRQDSRIQPEQWQNDPENRWLARGARFRVSAETIRDNALAISGLLSDRVGGPSVKPYQPEGLWEDVTVERRGKYVADRGEDLYRRSMYTFWKRTCPPPSMMSFDAPNREICLARRAQTNTPLQSLILLNDPTYIEASRKLAERMIRLGGPEPFDRLSVGYRLGVAREPNSEEQKIVSELLREVENCFRASPLSVSQLLGVGESKSDDSIDRTELASWTIIASTILNLDETVTKR